MDQNFQTQNRALLIHSLHYLPWMNLTESATCWCWVPKQTSSTSYKTSQIWSDTESISVTKKWLFKTNYGETMRTSCEPSCLWHMPEKTSRCWSLKKRWRNVPLTVWPLQQEPEYSIYHLTTRLVLASMFVRSIFGKHECTIFKTPLFIIHFRQVNCILLAVCWTGVSVSFKPSMFLSQVK